MVERWSKIVYNKELEIAYTSAVISAVIYRLKLGDGYILNNNENGGRGVNREVNKTPNAYLDNSATTKVFASSARKAYHVMTENFGNPSSLHTLGIEAEKEVEYARENVARLLGCHSDNIYFTSGGTEANNIAIFGAVKASKRRGNHIITSAVEHPSVSEPMKELEQRGFEVDYVMPDKNDEYKITAGLVLSLCCKDTILISIMAVNNETGMIFPVEQIAKAVKHKFPKVLIHCDAVQCVGKQRINLFNSNIDILTFSGHKFHAPKGCGGLYLKKNTRLARTIFGGGQEKNLRSGTESVPLIAALGESVRLLGVYNNPSAVAQHFSALNKHTIKALTAIDGVFINSDLNADKSAPYILNFSVKGIRSEIMLHHLASSEVYVSSGSACAKGGGSKVLQAFGIGRELSDCALRISFCEMTTIAEIDMFIDALKDGMERLIIQREPRVQGET